MALASIFPISDKSGVNLKGLYNKSNQTLIPVNDLEDKGKVNELQNQKFYKQFWVLLKYLSNPLKIFSNEAFDDAETLESLCNRQWVLHCLIETGLQRSCVKKNYFRLQSSFYSFGFTPT